MREQGEVRVPYFLCSSPVAHVSGRWGATIWLTRLPQQAMRCHLRAPYAGGPPQVDVEPQHVRVGVQNRALRLDVPRREVDHRRPLVNPHAQALVLKGSGRVLHDGARPLCCEQFRLPGLARPVDDVSPRRLSCVERENQTEGLLGHVSPDDR